jgi:uncharacterized membrane protein YdjX (TVP38/TMEM64 family)
MSYFLEWTAAVVLVTTLGLVIMPWLALAVLIVVLFATVAGLAALVAAAVAIPYVLGRSLHRRRRTRSRARGTQVLRRPIAAYAERK